MNVAVASEVIEMRTAWVFDDKKTDEQKLVGSLEAVGIRTRSETNIAAIEVSVQEILGGAPPPGLVVLDQHWDTHLQSLEPIGRADILIESPDLAGRAIARYLRSFDELRDTVLVMVSGLDEIGDYDDSEIGPMISLEKGDMDDFGERLQASLATEDARPAELGADHYTSGARKFLTGFAIELGLAKTDSHLLLGGERSKDLGEDAFVALLAASRDAKQRVRVLIDTAVLMHELYGQSLPALDKISADLGIPMREALLDGTFNQLLQIKLLLEARGGGTLDR
ncbi:hypothetical protein [Mesorhizobium sp. CO1-1-8]|uniref:hypothetical protein n=1 Tax=Mesorhizobium sp. CO1-1-8 TaxID=2876631 RepID=UPI001CD0CB3F|nr:hypothetical protein [Mesorhizobium sp. CO1-1-8]MBZ9772591.1 hypothetical protein [Mesorhizobium sp. CO1-1-8]